MSTLFLFSLFIAGLFAGAINVFSGGGSVLTLPLLIIAGLDANTANGTNRVGILLQTIAALLRFGKPGQRMLGQSLKLTLVTLPGAILGAWVAVFMDETSFHYLLIGVLLLSAVSLFMPNFHEVEPDHTPSFWLYPTFFAIGFYGGLIQVGVGFLLMAGLYHLLHARLVVVNIYKVLIIFLFTLPALGIFLYYGQIHWGAGLSLAAGMALGGWLAAHLSLQQSGENWIRAVTLLIVLLMIAKLLFNG
ncbi:sulfite exporter TauE/SafE family protein [Candidatus Venteria ishoeyi]|uniref:Probable membrane transporter protein n=1 Tax=Candidatus Venteria ishoeyi TaxID=1899563 RepID=A0A1H6FB18_9GAMM|nr:sulfite exporter TauE/SafE family protein [Candidatus Venteria ishoeyi]MDM8547009.1 sulfite exporter TauE/SafE family protein [Candidatus Venteria ishoeyi]SEH06571.1 Uncharacterised protein [Candidatus Venteria ishoeyi]